MTTKTRSSQPTRAKKSNTAAGSTSKRSAGKGTLETIYDKAKDVVGEILHGAAAGAAAGTVTAVAETVGVVKPQKKTVETGSAKSSNGTSASNGKRPAAKSTSAAAGPSKKTAKAKAAAKAPASARTGKTPARTSA